MTCCCCIVIPDPLDHSHAGPRVGGPAALLAAGHPLYPTWVVSASLSSIVASWMEGRNSVACLSFHATTTADGRVRVYGRHSLFDGLRAAVRGLGSLARREGKLGPAAATQTVETRRGVYNIFSFSSTALAVNLSPRVSDEGNQHEPPRARNTAAAMPGSSHHGQGPLRPMGAPCGRSKEDADKSPSR